MEADMRKLKGFAVLVFLFLLPLFAHADEVGGPAFDYNVDFRGFYWGTTVTTPVFSSSNSSFGATVDVRFGKNSGMPNWGFGAEYTSTPTGPRFVNTGGMFQTVDFAGRPGFPVPIGGGTFGLVVPGQFQFGGGK